MNKNLLYVALLLTIIFLKKEMITSQRILTGILLLIVGYNLISYIYLFLNDWIYNSSCLLFILIPDWRDSFFYKLLNKKYPNLFNYNSVKLLTSPKKVGNYVRKSRSRNVQLIETYTKSSKRSYTLTFENTPDLENEALFISLFKGMKKYLNTKKFGNNKSIISQVIINGHIYSLHKNVKINNKTTPSQYWDLIKDQIETNFDKDYLIEVYPIIKLIVYNLDDKRNKSIIVHKNNSELTLSERLDKVRKIVKNLILNKRKFSTNITPLNKDKIMKPFLIFNKSMLSNISNITVNRVFVHDLDNSLFNYINNYLLDNFDHNLIEVIQDKNNNYIYIKIFSLKFINSHRIFPVSEQELINLFDGFDLFDALTKAQIIYFEKYNLDLTSIVSTGSLAFKLFRINFLKKYNSIPILSKSDDSIIRQSYFGGGVHVFKLNQIIKNVFHYDINSLYPFAMLKAMPFKLLKTFIPNSKFKLNDFFGFCKVEITISNKCKKILIPHRVNDKVIYSSGTFIGVYFSEELKLYFKNNHYKIKFLECYEFSKFYPFKDYVNIFYEIKANSSGVNRFISKLLLNNLYGFFGRSYYLIKTMKINNNDLNTFMKKSNDQIVNIETLDNYSLIKLIETNDNYQIKSSVAISSAITSYARIIMHPYLLLPFVIYSDTDSIFTTVPLNPKLINKAIGYFKDEMNGLIIKEFISLGPKRYGYWFIDKNNQKIERSVYAGIERNSISFKYYLDKIKSPL